MLLEIIEKTNPLIYKLKKFNQKFSYSNPEKVNTINRFHFEEFVNSPNIIK
jgi:hypothetical protein